MSEQTLHATETPKLNRAGIGRLLTVVLSQVLVAAIFFVAAGDAGVTRAWIYYGGLLGYLLIAVIVMLAAFPGVAEVVNERGHAFRADTERWDKAFAVVYSLLLLVTPAIAGLDVGRFQWTWVPGSLVIPALGITLLATVFVHWAMIVNRHAETGVRIQAERGHQVVTTGPYHFVRHPFYLSSIVIQLMYPLAIGSLVAYAPALAICALFVWRTAREDRLLHERLPGYAAYARAVRFRLLPGLW